MEIYLGNALTASDLNHDTVLSLIGDIEGDVTFGYDNSTLELTTDASNIVSSTAEANKALKLDSDLVLQATSADTKKLDHNIVIELTDAVTGSATTDLSGNKVSIKTTISDTNVLKKTDIGTILPDLDNNKKIKDIYLPDQSKGGFKIVGLWSSNTTAPSTTPTENTAWIVTGDCTFSSMTFKTGDWIYYYNSSWNRADISDSIHSINGYTGNSITLDYDDVNAISDTYIDYTIGATVPKDKIPVTDKAGHLSGVTVDKLTKEFNLKTAANGHVKIDTTNSTNTKTDGSKDLDISLEITEDGYTAIADELRRDIKDEGKNVPFRKNLNFVDFNITDESSTNTITIKPNYLEIDEVLYFNGSASASFKSRLEIKYEEKDTRPFYVAYRDNNGRIQFVGMNSNTPNPPAGAGTISIPTGEYSTVLESNKVITKVATANITFDSGGNISNFTITRTNSTAQALPLAGGTMTGTITTRALTPSANNTYSVGTSAARYSNGYFTTTNTTNLVVNGKRLFMQSGTPSGASNGDIWIVTK